MFIINIKKEKKNHKFSPELVLKKKKKVLFLVT